MAAPSDGPLKALGLTNIPESKSFFIRILNGDTVGSRSSGALLLNTLTLKQIFAFPSPRSLHKSHLGERQLWVTWVTFDDTRESIAVYGTDKPQTKVVGNSTKFVDGGITRKVRYIHRVLLSDLQSGQRYGKRRSVDDTLIPILIQ